MIEADERWRFVGGKRCRRWVRVAVDAETRHVVAMVCGRRDERTARCRWDALPDEYRDGAVTAVELDRA